MQIFATCLNISSLTQYFLHNVLSSDIFNHVGGGDKNKQGHRGLADNYKISLPTAYFQLVDMKPKEDFTEL